MQQHSTAYTIGFSAAVCIVCSLLVSTATVALRPRQRENARLDRQRNVLVAAGFLGASQKVSRAKVDELFGKVRPVVIDLKKGEETDVDPATFDQRRAASDPARSEVAPPNAAKVRRVPHNALVYEVLEGDKVTKVVLPVEGKGLWSTLYGFLAVDADGTTVRGLTFYQHAETPGLGGEVDNEKWKALWPGRKVYGPDGQVALRVIKGTARSPEDDPHRVDGLSGATMTSRGVSHLVAFWMGENGFAPFLKRLKQSRS